MTHFDRCAELRKRKETVDFLASGAACVPLWRNRVLIARGEPVGPAYLALDQVRAIAPDAEPVLLGKLEGRAVFAVDLPGDEGIAKAFAGADFNDLRMAAGMLAPVDVEVLSFARGLLHWRRHHRFCGKCGQPARSEEAGHALVCSGCSEKSFPRTDPAIMALVTSGERCLLARQASWPKGMYSVLAGFVEPGETLEQAVVREVREEVGIHATDVRYLRSQPWPFPCSLMIGFSCRAADDAIHVDADEIEQARWFTRAEIAAQDGFFIPPPYSLAHQLILAFVNQSGPRTQRT